MITDVLENAKPRPRSPFYAEISALIQVEVQNALSGKKSVEQSLKDAQKALSEIVE